MNTFEFVSHERYPDEKFICESAVLSIEGKYRVTYIRKMTQNGGRYWDEISAGVTLHGEKKYLKAWKCDSCFLREDIIDFLEKRTWEKAQLVPKEISLDLKSDDVPF